MAPPVRQAEARDFAPCLYPPIQSARLPLTSNVRRPRAGPCLNRASPPTDHQLEPYHRSGARAAAKHFAQRRQLWPRPGVPHVTVEAQSPCSSSLFLHTIPCAALIACRKAHLLCADAGPSRACAACWSLLAGDDVRSCILGGAVAIRVGLWLFSACSC